MRRITSSRRPSEYGQPFSGHWATNPWINSHNRRAVAVDKQQQKTALSAWEDEGGSTATSSQALGPHQAMQLE